MLFVVKTNFFVINILEKILIPKEMSHPNLKLVKKFFKFLNKLIGVDNFVLYFQVNRFNNLVDLVHVVILNVNMLLL